MLCIIALELAESIGEILGFHSYYLYSTRTVIVLILRKLFGAHQVCLVEVRTP
jgi:hypothetical protein